MSKRRRRVLYRRAIEAQDVELRRVGVGVAYYASKDLPLPFIFSAWALRSFHIGELLKRRRDREGIRP
jgi:hypothetical protein